MALISVSNNALSNITAVPASIPTGALTLIKSITASASASIEFINGTDGVVLDGTYSSYVFKFINMHPQTDAVNLQFQGSTNGGSSYGITITSTFFRTAHNEADTATAFGYITGDDLAQSTSFQKITHSTDIGNDNDQNANGYLQIFNPSSTTYVKHFMARTSFSHSADYEIDNFTAGYFNDGANAINAIKFQMSSGNIDDGTIKLYGVK